MLAGISPAGKVYYQWNGEGQAIRRDAYRGKH